MTDLINFPTRRPTGQVSHPLVLLEGEQKSGKTWAMGEFTASPRVGESFWMDFAEGAADEYGAIPGADYHILRHTGAWSNIMRGVNEVRDFARKQADAGEKPVLLCVDNMSAEWEMLKDWTSDRAKGSPKNKAKLEKDPDAEIDIPTNYWNDANARHKQLMAKLMTFPGIVVMTARGKPVNVIGAGGAPTGQKTYTLDAQKGLGNDVSMWIRMFRDSDPLVIGARSVKYGKKPGVDDPEPIQDFTLDRLIFDIMGYRPDTAQVRELVTLDASALNDLRDRVLDKNATVDDLRSYYAEAGPALTAITTDGSGDEIKMADLILARVREVDPKALKAAPAAEAVA